MSREYRFWEIKYHKIEGSDHALIISFTDNVAECNFWESIYLKIIATQNSLTCDNKLI